MHSGDMDGEPPPASGVHPDAPAGEPLTSFDPVTAAAVVTVLARAGIPAWQDRVADRNGDVGVRVPAGMRSAGMHAMGQRMDEIAALTREGAASPAVGGPRSEEDGAATRPAERPLVMERFADLRIVVVVVLGPLLAVTIAGPFLSRAARGAVFASMAIGLVTLLVVRRRRR